MLMLHLTKGDFTYYGGIHTSFRALEKTRHLIQNLKSCATAHRTAAPPEDQHA